MIDKNVINGLPEDATFFKLTPKQQGMVKSKLIDGDTHVEAYKKNYNVKEGASPQSVYSSARQVLKSPKVEKAIRQIWTEAGVSTEMIAKAHLEALSATRVVINTKEGTIDETTIPDHVVRLRAAKQAADILSDTIKEASTKNQTLNLTVQASEELEQEISQFLKNKYRKKGPIQKPL